MAKTIVIMIDAFRKSYLNERDTPFLHQFSKKFFAGELKQPFGFKNAVGFFTGIHPSKIGQFANYGYNGNLRRFPYQLFLKPFPGKLKFHAINLFNFFRGEDLFLPAIDLNYFKFFQRKQTRHFYQKKSVPVKTIFDFLRENKTKYLFYDFPLIIENGKPKLHWTLKNDDEARVKKFLKLIRKKEYDFYYLHLVDLDSIGHAYGPDSPEMKEALRKEDLLVKKVLSEFDIEKDNVMIWSDHGMVAVTKKADLKSKLPAFGKGYVYFLDSTMARFWFFNSSIRRKVLSILKKQKGGRVVSEKEKKRLGIDFKDNFYGDEIFLADSGTLIFPNFFNASFAKGMHGYDISDKNEMAFFMLNKKSKTKAKTEDLFPTLLEMLGLKGKIPSGIDGKSLLSGK